jgi:hypothetical protein
MKALSIRQPWAWAILHAGKDVENRDWSDRYQGMRDARALIGQDFLIHASAGMTRFEYEDFLDTAQRTISLTHPFPPGTMLPPMRDLPKGGIVGVATLHGIVFDRYDSPWFFGPVGLVLRNARPLPFMPCKGILGFFDAAIEDPAGVVGP